MDLGLTGKNAAVTGASQGIGYAIANALAREGCNVALAARGEERLNKAVADMQKHGVTAVGIVADLASENRRILASIEEEFRPRAGTGDWR